MIGQTERTSDRLKPYSGIMTARPTDTWTDGPIGKFHFYFKERNVNQGIIKINIFLEIIIDRKTNKGELIVIVIC